MTWEKYESSEVVKGKYQIIFDGHIPDFIDTDLNLDLIPDIFYVEGKKVSFDGIKIEGRENTVTVTCSVIENPILLPVLIASIIGVIGIFGVYLTFREIRKLSEEIGGGATLGIGVVFVVLILIGAYFLYTKVT